MQLLNFFFKKKKKKKMTGHGITRTNNNIKHTMKEFRSLENRGILLKGTTILVIFLKEKVTFGNSEMAP